MHSFNEDFVKGFKSYAEFQKWSNGRHSDADLKTAYDATHPAVATPEPKVKEPANKSLNTSEDPE